MSSSVSAEVRLVVYASDSATRITIVDGNLRELYSGLGSIDALMAPGLYKIRFQTGTSVEERYAVLEPGTTETVEIGVPPIAFTSPAPLADTRLTRPAHVEHAQRIAASQPGVKLGRGSDLLLFARDCDAPATTSGSRPSPAAGLGLHTLGGKPLVDFGAACKADVVTADPWAGVRVELDPGSYRLRLDLGDERLEQIIAASPGWQTQLFLLQTTYRTSAGAIRRADLGNASMLLSRSGFDASDPVFRLAELGRQGLVARDVVIRREDLSRMLRGKFQHPILGVYAVHLLMLAPKPDRDLVRMVADNLYALLGPHPDVLAAKLWLGDVPTRGTPDFSAPPMLRSSYRIISDATAASPQMVPAGSLTATIATRVWGAGPWLIWEHERDEGPVKPPLDPVSPGVHSGPIPISDPAAWLGDADDTRDLEDALVGYLVRARLAGQPQTARSLARGPWEAARQIGPDLVPAQRKPDRDLVRALGVPWSVVDALMTRLRSKLAAPAPDAGASSITVVDARPLHACLAMASAEPTRRDERLALVKSALWQPGDKIRVSFLDGDPSLRERVIAAARTWLEHANLNLYFGNDADADIRISFRMRGSWSKIGRECRTVAREWPTMNFGWLAPTTPDDELRRVVLHEFGHALGCLHEHQSPAGGIQWDKERVYAAFAGPPNFWPRERVDRNLFEAYAADLTQFSAFDPKSIMAYPIPADFTLDGFHLELNRELSETDKAFMRSVYPF